MIFSINTKVLGPASLTSTLAGQDFKAVSMMHVETDTGMANEVPAVSKAIKSNSEALFVLDCATSLGGMEVKADTWGADICFSGSHKCLSGPVGLAFVEL